MLAPATERPPPEESSNLPPPEERLSIHGQLIERCPVADKPLRDRVVTLKAGLAEPLEAKTDHAGSFAITTRREPAQLVLAIEQKEVPLSGNPEGDYFVSLVVPCSDPGSPQGEAVADVKMIGAGEIPRKQPPLTPKNWPTEGPLQKSDPVSDD